jgi:hypothetical protein
MFHIHACIYSYVRKANTHFMICKCLINYVDIDIVCKLSADQWSVSLTACFTPREIVPTTHWRGAEAVWILCIRVSCPCWDSSPSWLTIQPASIQTQSWTADWQELIRIWSTIKAYYIQILVPPPAYIAPVCLLIECLILDLIGIPSPQDYLLRECMGRPDCSWHGENNADDLQDMRSCVIEIRRVYWELLKRGNAPAEQFLTVQRH